MQFKVEGLKNVVEQLDQLKAELAVKVLAQAARRAFMPVLRASQTMVPEDTGALMAAIKLKVSKPKSGDSVVVVGIKIGGPKKSIGPKTKAEATTLPPARRWHFVEFGTAHMAAHPFLRPALDQNATAISYLFKKELADAIQRALKRSRKA